METTARNRTIGGIVIGAIILILLLVLFSCTVNSDPESSPKKDPTTGESSQPSDQDTLEPDDKPSESESEDAEGDADDDIVPAANTGVTFIPAGNVPSGSTPTCELDKSACEPTRPPGAGVDICEIRPDLDQCQPPPTTPPGDGEPSDPPGDGDGDGDCILGLICIPGGEEPGPGEPDPVDNTKPKCTTPPVVTSKTEPLGLKLSYRVEWGEATDNSNSVEYELSVDGEQVSKTSRTSYTAFLPLSADEFSVVAVDPSGNERDCGSVALNDDEDPQMGPVDCQALGLTELKVTWKRATDDSQRIHHYTVRNTQGEVADKQTKNSATYSGLDPQRSYDFQVTATDWSGNESDPVGLTCATDNEDPELPSAPRVDDITATTADLSWAPATDDSGIDHYEVTWEPAGSVLGIGSRSETTTEPKFRVDGLTSSTEYTFTVVAFDVAQKDSEPATVTDTTKADGDDAVNTPRKGLKGSSKNQVEVPSEAPAEEKSTLVPPLGDVLSGEDKDAATGSSESESPAERPTTEEPAEEKDAPAEEDKDEDKDGILGGLVGSLSAAVSAVF